MLTQEEYNLILGYDKKFKKDDQIQLGPHPHRWTREIISTNSHDTFLLDFTRNSIEIKKFSVNKRYKTAVVMLRYCSNGIHTNPDSTTINGPHVHLYREMYDDKIAFDPSTIGIDPAFDMEQVFRRIMEYTNIKDLPVIQVDLY